MPAEPRPRKPFNLERTLGVSAMLVALSSLLVSVYQTHLMRQSQNASVLPYLMIGLTSNGDGVYMTVRNAGIGPALVTATRIVVDGRAIESDAYDYFLSKRPEHTQALSVDRMFAGRLIPPGEGVQMVGKPAPKQDEMLGDLLALFELAEVPRPWLAGVGVPLTDPHRAVLEIEYSSVYGDRWRVRSDRIVPDAR